MTLCVTKNLGVVSMIGQLIFDHLYYAQRERWEQAEVRSVDFALDFAVVVQQILALIEACDVLNVFFGQIVQLPEISVEIKIIATRSGGSENLKKSRWQKNS